MFKNLKIRGKFLLASAFSVVALIVVAALSFYTRTLISRDLTETAISSECAESLNDFASMITDFMSTEEGLQPAIQMYAVSKGEYGASFSEIYSVLDGTIEELRAADVLFANNREITYQVMSLTDVSISQSNGYIEQVAARLADESQRTQVSALERLVIIGANMNTSLAYTTKVEYLRLVDDITIGNAVLDFLDTMIENAGADAERLKGTDFEQLPINAINANVAIKAGVQQYITNVQELRNVQNEVVREIERQAELIQSTANAQLNNAFGFIMYSQLLSAVMLLAMAVISFAVILLVSGKLSKSLRAITATSVKLAAGDVNVNHLKARSNDEVGVLTHSFNEMTVSLKKKSDAVSRIASGDLTGEIEVASPRDILGNSLVSMQDSLRKILGGVIMAVEQLLNGSDQIAQSSQVLASGASEQAGSIQSIADSASGANDQSQQNADSAREASSLATKATEGAKEGNESMRELLISMARITESSGQIQKITKVIDDIAFQINLLALNANVEAARAGKYGKGFAVVAEEVRNLAVRSAGAVKETNEMVDAALSAIQSGNGLAEKTATQLSDIVNGVTKVSDLLDEIEISGSMQTKVFEEVTNGLGEIDKVTQSNSAGAEESASAAEELSSQAQYLRSLVGQFTIGDVSVTDSLQVSEDNSSDEGNAVNAETYIGIAE